MKDLVVILSILPVDEIIIPLKSLLLRKGFNSKEIRIFVSM